MTADTDSLKPDEGVRLKIDSNGTIILILKRGGSELEMPLRNAEAPIVAALVLGAAVQSYADAKRGDERIDQKPGPVTNLSVTPTAVRLLRENETGKAAIVFECGAGSIGFQLESHMLADLAVALATIDRGGRKPS